MPTTTAAKAQHQPQQKRGLSSLALQLISAPEASRPAMVRGIALYQDHPYRRPQPRYTEIFRAGQLRLLRHATPTAGASTQPPLLLIPSVINRTAIMDLLPGQSFMRFFEQSGRDVILLDWGNPVEDEAMNSLDSLVAQRLLPVLRYLSAECGRPVDSVGYCLGGVLSIAAAVLQGDAIGRMILLGAPWDFHAGQNGKDEGGLLTSVAAATPAAFQGMAERGYLPASWIQSVFTAANGPRTAEKFIRFAAMDMDSAEAKRFVAVEDWLNDAADLPRGLAQGCISEFYGDNAPMQKNWRIQGQAIDPSAISNHMLIVAGADDRLVPMASSLALAKTVRNADVLTPMLGHVGMMASRRAKRDLWARIETWLN